MLKFAPTPPGPFKFKAVKALNQAQKSLQIVGRIEVQTEREKDLKMSGIVDFITFCALGYEKI